jgi:hypothetical protein
MLCSWGRIFKIPFEEFETGGAKIGLFEIGILNTGGRIHNASTVPAMGKAHGMAEFV